MTQESTYGQQKQKYTEIPSQSYSQAYGQVCEVLRYSHYAYRTEQTYGQWIRRYMRYCGGETHPDRLGAQDVERLLSHLATEGKVSASTQRQALNAVVFLYRDVLLMPLTGHLAPVRSKRQPRPPTVLTQGEVQRLLAALSGTHALMATLLYGAGLRLLECLRLRVQDVDCSQNLIFVRGGKGGRDRTTLLPQHLREALQGQIEQVKALHHHDLEEGFGAVYLPEALAQTYPRAARETGWQWVFPARKRSRDPRSGRELRHHVLESGPQRLIPGTRHATWQPTSPVHPTAARGADDVRPSPPPGSPTVFPGVVLRLGRRYNASSFVDALRLRRPAR